ncbi:hypothetical protein BOC41_13100 [Burkholderia pseudomallei]|uniref:amidohydrolase family protein n=1 Tax=Burkholderia pseudomallei TaxID=28450 RepID=UPI000A1A2648|nr:amidohydrolase family protein [Burkholderia pseudomallei]ARL01897.1 hypothetical protein BOC44_09170 [Burkholderia pseudomallei]OSP97076.1 hypothetical protein BOC41_12360 [Burkholderia pseudomallei]OSP97196.1 hypothetical protein BOC41_13100 [Burkholderia pseudomallei]
MDQASNDPAVETTGRPFATRTYEARKAHEAREAHDKCAPLVDAWYGSGAAPIEAVDSHAHVFLRSLPRIPSARHSPEYDATLESYVAHLSACGITHAVLVQPSFLGTDNHFFVDALARYPQRFRGIAVVNPCTAEDEFARLEATDVVGIRLNLVGLPIPDFTAPRWRALLARANALGWHVEVHRRAADLPAIIPALLDQSCRVVVDHFGRPAPHLGTLDPGFRFLLSIAGTGQVWVKLSAAYRNIGSGDGTAFGTRAARALLGAFAPNRLVWGSDWPHTQHRDRTDYQTTRSALDDWVPDPSLRRIILCDSARALFRFDRQTPARDT